MLNRRAVLRIGAAALLHPSLALAQGKPARVFAGTVAQFDAKGRTLVMDSPGSRKYPHPRIRWNAKTRWTGLAVKSHSAKPGQPVRVDVVQEKDGSFTAERIDLVRPESRPVSGGRTAPR